MARLYFFYSTMNAGKTTALLQCYHNYTESNFNTLLFVPEISDKKGMITSRLGLTKKAIIIKPHFNIFKFVKKYDKNLTSILIDEAQFLKKKHIFEIIAIVDILKISVLTYGLRTDFKSKLFEASKYLLALSDKLIEIKTLCKCGKKAVMNARLDKNKKTLHGKQINTNKKLYIPLCRQHYYQTKTTVSDN